MIAPAAMKIVALLRAWLVRWYSPELLCINEAPAMISPMWLQVLRAMILLISVCTVAVIAA